MKNGKNGGKGFLSLLASRFRSRALAYGYANARVRAMKRNLLSSEDMDRLLKVGDINSVIGLLETTNYKKDIVSLAVKYSGEELVERAVSRNFASDAQKALRVAPSFAKPAVGVLLQRYDIANIKTVLLGKSLGKPASELTEDLVVAGELPMHLLSKMASAHTVLDAVSLLRGTSYAVPPEISEGGDAKKICKYLERAYYDRLKEKIRKDPTLDPDLLKLAGLEIDVRNVTKNLLCKELSKKGHVCIMKRGEKLPMHEGGSLGRAFLEKSHSTGTIEEEISEVEKRLNMKGLSEIYARTKSVAQLEMEIERRMAREKVLLFHKGVLSIGAIAGYVFLKEEEMRNVRKIIRGRQYGLSTEQIRDMLITVN